VYRVEHLLQKPIKHYPPHLRHIATLPQEIENQIFCRYSADTEENANKLHLSAPVVLPIVRWSDWEHLFVHEEKQSQWQTAGSSKAKAYRT